MIRFFKSSILVIMLYTLFIATAYADKVTVCHIPPSNPANFHDITISEKALQAHLNHGDFLGSCSAHCEALCDDGDACTQDYVTENGECVCLDGHPPVDCDDSNPCTADLCDPDVGCEYNFELSNGTACDDGHTYTTDDVCTQGLCSGTHPCPCTATPYYLLYFNDLTPDMSCIVTDSPPGDFYVQIQSGLFGICAGATNIEYGCAPTYQNVPNNIIYTTYDIAEICFDLFTYMAYEAGITCVSP